MSVRGAYSFDHLGRRSEDRRRNRDAERCGSLEVDDQLEARGLLDWQVGGAGALEDPGQRLLLRPNRARKGSASHRTKNDATLHSITSSARASSNGEITIPSALA